MSSLGSDVQYMTKMCTSSLMPNKLVIKTQPLVIVEYTLGAEWKKVLDKNINA